MSAAADLLLGGGLALAGCTTGFLLGVSWLRRHTTHTQRWTQEEVDHILAESRERWENDLDLWDDQ